MVLLLTSYNFILLTEPLAGMAAAFQFGPNIRLKLGSLCYNYIGWPVGNSNVFSKTTASIIL